MDNEQTIRSLAGVRMAIGTSAWATPRLAGKAFGLEWRGAMVVGGAVLGVGAALISRWWSRIYIAELREGP